MNYALNLDTLSAVQSLTKDYGFKAKQAEGIVKTLAQAELGEVATTVDLKELELSVVDRITSTEMRFYVALAAQAGLIIGILQFLRT